MTPSPSLPAEVMIRAGRDASMMYISSEGLRAGFAEVLYTHKHAEVSYTGKFATIRLGNINRLHCQPGSPDTELYHWKLYGIGKME